MTLRVNNERDKILRVVKVRPSVTAVVSPARQPRRGQVVSCPAVLAVIGPSFHALALSVVSVMNRESAPVSLLNDPVVLIVNKAIWVSGSIANTSQVTIFIVLVSNQS